MQLAIVGTGVVVAAASSVLISSASLTGGPAGIVLGVLAVCAASVPLLSRLTTDRLDAPGLYGLASLIMFGLTSLAWLGRPIDPGPGLDRDDVANALLVVAAALALFAAGSAVVGRAQTRRPPDASRSSPASLMSLAVVFGAGALLVAFALGFGLYGYISPVQQSGAALTVTGVLNNFAKISSLAIIAIALTYYTWGGRSMRWLLIASVALQISLGVFGGIKGAALEPVILVLLAYILARRRVPWAGIGAAVFVTLVVLLPVNLIYRDQVRVQGIDPTSGLTAAVSQASSSDRPESLGGASLDPIDYLLVRFRQIDTIALITSLTPSPFAHDGREQYTALPLLLAVPRVLWPEKPSLTEAGEFSHTYWQIDPNTQTSTAITQIGDLYRAFALPGVAIGMFAWGMVLSAWSRWTRNRPSLRVQLVYIYSLTALVTYVESDLPNVVSIAGRGLPFAMVVAWLLLPGRGGEPGYRSLFARPRAGARQSAVTG
jgi:hypothetical protein